MIAFFRQHLPSAFLLFSACFLGSNAVAQWVQLSAGSQHVVAINQRGQLEAWGSNAHHQCEVPPITNAIAVAAGDKHTLALDDEGNVYAWGRNSDGQCDVPKGLKARAIAAGSSHSVAINTKGHLVAWGNNRFNQCAIPSSLQSTQVAAIDAGALHTVVITEAGLLRGWGSSNAGESSPPRDIPVTALDCSGSRCVALQANGELVQWGGYVKVNSPKYTEFQSIAIGGDADRPFLAAQFKDGSWHDYFSSNSTKANVPLPENLTAAPQLISASETLFAWVDQSNQLHVNSASFIDPTLFATLESKGEAPTSAPAKEDPVDYAREFYTQEAKSNHSPFHFNRGRASDVASIAIIPVDGNQQCDGAIQGAADLLPLAETALLGTYQVLERDMIDKALEEVRLSLTGITSEEHVLEAGRIKNAKGQTWPVRRVDEVLASRPDVALFSAGSDVSKKWAYAFIERVCVDREYALRLKLIDCETTELIWTALGVGMDDSEFFREVSNALQAR